MAGGGGKGVFNPAGRILPLGGAQLLGNLMPVGADVPLVEGKDVVRAGGRLRPLGALRRGRRGMMLNQRIGRQGLQPGALQIAPAVGVGDENARISRLMHRRQDATGDAGGQCPADGVVAAASIAVAIRTRLQGRVVQQFVQV